MENSMTTETPESDLEFADARVRRNLPIEAMRKIAKVYRARQAAGKVTRPLTLALARIIHAAAEDR